MKKIRILQIASVLLCLVMLLASCNEKAPEANNNPNPQPETPDTPVTAVGQENFFNLSYIEPEYLSDPTLMTDTYGELLEENSSDGLLVFLKKTKDFMNNLTDTYTVYSVVDKAVVKTFTLTYADENYGREDDFKNPVLPEKTLKVYAYGDRVNPDSRVDYIMAVYETNTLLNKDVIEDNELEYSYSTSYSVEFYDAKGTAITTTKNFTEASYVSASANEERLALSFGKTVAIFDTKENKLVSTLNGDTGRITGMQADFSNDKYDYYLYVPYGYVDYMSPLGSGGKIEVYNKSEELVCEYIYNDFSNISYAYVLESGDILLQMFKGTEKLDYNFLTEGNKVEMQTFILDVETGKVSEIAFNYIINNLYGKDEWAAIMEEDYNTAITFVDANVRNIALGRKVENGYIVKDYEDVIFFDNFLTINHVHAPKILEQQSSSFATKLSGGYELIEVVNGVAELAIVKDGKIVSYVPEGAIVTEYGIISENNIYDFNMVKLTSWGEVDNNENYNYVTFFGKYAVFTETIVPDEFNLITAPYDVVRLYDMSAETWSNRLDNCTVTDGGIAEDYMIIYNKVEKTYSLYNGEMSCLLSGDDIDLEECADGYVVEVTVDGTSYIFLLSNSKKTTTV